MQAPQGRKAGVRAASGCERWRVIGAGRAACGISFFRGRIFAAGLGLAVLTATCALADDTNLMTQAKAEGAPAQRDLTEIPIEDLAKIRVTLVSKKEEALSESPAAISVLTQEDIRRSGATSIPEALRLVPGLDVAQLDAHNWAISARGFNDVFADKLLVMQDGRSLYTPLFSGVFWDVQDTYMDDIDRIEVVRGPGASLWGANAVNGVINIITKSAKDTQGWLVNGGGGTEEREFGGARFGGKVGEDVYFRVYGKYFDREDFDTPGGGDAEDSWQMGQGGFRVDWDASAQDQFTLQGDIYGGRENQTYGTYNPANPLAPSLLVSNVERVGGGNMLGKWAHAFSDTSDLKLQMYYDRTDRDEAIFKESRDTYDIDAQHHFALGERNDFVWGAGYRLSADRIGNTPTVSFNPNEREQQLVSAFAQDEITLVERKLRLTVGAKVEHNDYTGFNFQPSGRLLWTPNAWHTVWGSISRAVRTPSQAEEEVRINQVLPSGAVAQFNGDRGYGSETLTAYELGYRVQMLTNLSVDLASFYNDYRDLRSIEPGATPPPPPPPFIIPLFTANNLHGDTYGLEASATWQVAEWWRLQPAYTLLKMQLYADAGSLDTTSTADAGKSPQQQFSLRSGMDLPWHTTLDCTLRYVDELPALNIPSYVTMDARLSWRVNKNLELSAVGQNLFSGRHAEFTPSFINTQVTEVPRSGYVKVTWRF
jgi:iron complex outermembrane receptor protein